MWIFIVFELCLSCISSPFSALNTLLPDFSNLITGIDIVCNLPAVLKYFQLFADISNGRNLQDTVETAEIVKKHHYVGYRFFGTTYLVLIIKLQGLMK